MLRRVFLLVLLMLLSSCKNEETGRYSAEKAAFSVQKSSFGALNGWKNDDLRLFDKALRDVCDVMLKRGQNVVNNGHIRYSLAEYKEHCRVMSKINTENELKAYIERNFVPYLVLANGRENGKFTSYYEAEIQASYEKRGKYQYPIYGKPKDLVEINLRDFDSSLPNQRLIGRVQNGKVVKYYTRKEVDEGKLDAPVILWGDDPVDIFIMQIQGAAVATLPNGQQVRVGYAENNGHKFKGIGSILLEKGLIKREDASMPKIRTWLKENSTQAKKQMALNERYIFHKIVEADGPLGAMGLPLVAGRSMAVDKDYIPLGAMMWLETTAPNGRALNKLVMAEDVGSAIKGAVRGDYFWGFGEEAFNNAGRMNSGGRYYILLPKNTEVKTYE